MYFKFPSWKAGVVRLFFGCWTVLYDRGQLGSFSDESTLPGLLCTVHHCWAGGWGRGYEHFPIYKYKPWVRHRERVYTIW